MKTPKKTLEHYGMSEHEYRWRVAKHDFLEELREYELDELSVHGDTYKRNVLKEVYDILIEEWGEHIAKGPSFATFYEEHPDENNQEK